MAQEHTEKLLTGISQADLPVGCIVEAFESADLAVNRRTVERIQSGARPGTVLDLFYAYKHQLNANNARLKNKYYYNLADTIIQLEDRQKDHPYRLKSVGLTKLVAEDLGTSREDVNALIMGARADILTNLNYRTLHSFADVMADFFKKHCVRTSLDVWKTIRNLWDQSPQRFYELVNEMAGISGSNRVNGSLLGSLVPYEAYFVRDHYAFLMEQDGQCASPLDQKVGEQIVVTESPRQIKLNNEGIDSLLGELPLRYDRDALMVNMRVFAFGDPTRKMKGN